MKTKSLLTTLIVVLALIACEKENIVQPDQSQAEEIATRAGGPGKNQGKNPPVANAGVDTTAYFPTGPIFLNGSGTDPDNNITGYLWTKISGPSSFTFDNAKAAKTYVRQLVQGVYQFELKVTDKTKLVDRDTVQVTVNAPIPPPPCITNCGKIVFVSDRDGNNEIYSCDDDGSNVTRLTNDAAWDGDPVWSPDGTRIAFTSNRDGYQGVYIMNADGSNVVQRALSVNPDGGILGLTWSPDGTKIAYSDYAYFSEYGFYEGAVIYTVSATSGSPLLLFGDGFEPAWSPDGTKIALTVKRDTRFEGFSTYNIYTINADGTGFTPLTPYLNSGFDLFYNPSWSPNGAKLAMGFTGESSGTHISVMNSDGSGFTLLKSGGTPTSWSPDGTRIAYTDGNTIKWVASNGSASGIIITNGWDADWKH